jgi:hypothetical protein
MVRLAGIEPTTPWFVAKYSIQLSYSRVKRKYITGSICREAFQRIHDPARGWVGCRFATRYFACLDVCRLRGASPDQSNGTTFPGRLLFPPQHKQHGPANGPALTPRNDPNFYAAYTGDSGLALGNWALK